MIMEALWDAGEPLLLRTVMERVNARASKLSAYTTVQTVADRLVHKDAHQLLLELAQRSRPPDPSSAGDDERGSRSRCRRRSPSCSGARQAPY
jgi:Penicillinase repressor